MSRYGKAKIWYQDGTFRNAADEDAPKVGVICVVQWVGGARRISHGYHAYWELEGEWMGGDAHDLMMYLMGPGWKRVFYGAMINTHLYNAVMVQANEDPSFPKVQAA